MDQQDGQLKILGLHANSGSRYYRINPQLKWMQQQGHLVRLEKHDVPYLEQLIEWSDVVILQMVFSRDLVRKIKDAGKQVIFECDDLIHRTHAKHYSWEETNTIAKRLKMLWNIYRTISLCDGLVVSNKRLKRVYGWMAPRTLVFGNYMDLPHWLKEPVKNTTDRIRILWAGSISHTGDLEWVKPIMARILEKYPQVQFIYMGHGGVPSADPYARFIYGEDLFEGLPAERRESLLPAPPNVYPYLLAAAQADIAIAPLERNYFNTFKTQCKYLEYAINGIPGVYAKWFYTDVEDYGDGAFMPHSTGLVAESPEEWIDAISRLVEDATLREQIGERARREVIEKYNFADHAPRWQGFVEMISHAASHPQRTRAS